MAVSKVIADNVKTNFLLVLPESNGRLPSVRMPIDPPAVRTQFDSDYNESGTAKTPVRFSNPGTYDNHDNYDHSTNNWKWTAPVDGYYLVTALVAVWAITAFDIVHIYIEKTSSGPTVTDIAKTYMTEQWYQADLRLNQTVKLASGDTCRIMVQVTGSGVSRPMKGLTYSGVSYTLIARY